MQVHHDEGVANHIGPEPCVVGREANGDASVGDHIGQPLSRESRRISGAEAVLLFRRQYEQVRYSECLLDPAWSENLACVDAPCAGTGRSHVWPRRVTAVGPHREGEEP